MLQVEQLAFNAVILSGRAGALLTGMVWIMVSGQRSEAEIGSRGNGSWVRGDLLVFVTIVKIAA
jgi:hypothetical protein